jgi:hypothetical protein
MEKFDKHVPYPCLRRAKQLPFIGILEGNQGTTPEFWVFILQVDNARRFLSVFWRDVQKQYLACKLVTTDGGDFFSPNERWSRVGNEYRALVEPLDIANWYKAENHLKGSGHYIGKRLP